MGEELEPTSAAPAVAVLGEVIDPAALAALAAEAAARQRISRGL